MANPARTPTAAGARPRPRGSGTVGKRPLWLMSPTLVLLVLVIGVPFVVAVWISVLDLDQYTLR